MEAVEPSSDDLSEAPNPLLSSAPHVWERLIESVGPASLLLVIERRMSTGLRRVQTAEDILQDALLHAWRDRRQFEWRGLPSFRSWLLTLIDHRILDEPQVIADEREAPAASASRLARSARGKLPSGEASSCP